MVIHKEILLYGNPGLRVAELEPRLRAIAVGDQHLTVGNMHLHMVGGSCHQQEGMRCFPCQGDGDRCGKVVPQRRVSDVERLIRWCPEGDPEGCLKDTFPACFSQTAVIDGSSECWMTPLPYTLPGYL